jgi:hypothetical protein
VTVRWYLEIREELDSFVYILLDMTSWLVMERDTVRRRGDGPEDTESAKRKI